MNACCDMHNEHCEQPSETCCAECTENHHGVHQDVAGGPILSSHHDGSRCVETVPPDEWRDWTRVAEPEQWEREVALELEVKRLRALVDEPQPPADISHLRMVELRQSDKQPAPLLCVNPECPADGDFCACPGGVLDDRRLRADAWDEGFTAGKRYEYERAEWWEDVQSDDYDDDNARRAPVRPPRPANPYAALDGSNTRP